MSRAIRPTRVPVLRAITLACTLAGAATAPRAAVSHDWRSPALSDSAFWARSPVGTSGEIERLEKRIRRQGAPDSVKFALALAEAGTGTVEGRRRALELLDQVRASHRERKDFHWARARIYRIGHQASMARDALGEILRLDPKEVEAWVELARLQLEEILLDFDPGRSPPMFGHLARALEIEPDHRDALFLRSLVLELVASQPGRALPNLTAEGVRDLRRILSRDSTDAEARFLLAVHELDADRADEAAAEFARALAGAAPEVQEAFRASGWTSTSTAVRYASGLDERGRDLFHRAYWWAHDPTPLTRLNEDQLETWRRLVLADLLFGRPGEGLHGWETDPGEVLVRYGQPNSHSFDPAMLMSYSPIDQALPPVFIIGTGQVTEFTGGSVAASKAPLRQRGRMWNWDYLFRGVRFSLSFVDYNMNGRYYYSRPSLRKLAGMRDFLPAVFSGAPPGRIRHLYLASGGSATDGPWTRQTVDLGLPLWWSGRDRGWLKGVRCQIVIRDSTRAVVAQSSHRPTAGDLASVTIGRPLDLLLWRTRFTLRPGRYSMTAFVDDDDHQVHGSVSQPLVVRDFAAGTSLAVGDLELGLEGGAAGAEAMASRVGQDFIPDPLAMAGDDRRLAVFYDLYGLADRGETSRHQARYTILPREYLLEFERLAEAGQVDPGDLVSLASRLADSGTELNERNYSDVIFPPAEMPVAGGRAEKATRLVVPRLEAGEYAIVVTVTDLIAGSTAHRTAFFRVLTDQQRRELLTCSRWAMRKR